MWKSSVHFLILILQSVAMNPCFFDFRLIAQQQLTSYFAYCFNSFDVPEDSRFFHQLTSARQRQNAEINK